MAGQGLFVPLASQTRWFLLSCLFGAWAAMLYTLVGAAARLLPRGSPWVAAGDVLYWAAVTAAEFLFLCSLPQNALRWFHALGQGIGALLFHVTAASNCAAAFTALLRGAGRCGARAKGIFRPFECRCGRAISKIAHSMRKICMFGPKNIH